MPYNAWLDAAGAAGGVGNDLSRIFVDLARMRAMERQQGFQNNLAMQEMALREREFGAQQEFRQGQLRNDTDLTRAHIGAYNAQAEYEKARAERERARLGFAREASMGLAPQIFPMDEIQGSPRENAAILDKRKAMSPLLSLIAMEKPEAFIQMHNVGANAVGQNPLGQRIEGNLTLNPGEMAFNPQGQALATNTNFPPRASAVENNVSLLRGLADLVQSGTRRDELGDLASPETYPLATNAIPVLQGLLAQQGQRIGLTNQPSAMPSQANEVTRMTKDGKKAIFDANTKQFLRYAE